MHLHFSILFLILSLVITVHGVYNEKYCTQELFFKPYVRIYEEEGGDLLVDTNSGVRYTKSIANGYMCLNGPVIIYHDSTNTNEGALRFHDSHFGLFIHYCTYFNTQRSRGKPLPSFLNPGQIPNDPCPKPPNRTMHQHVPPYPNFKRWIDGIRVIGNTRDYRQPMLLKFRDKFYESRTVQVFPYDLNSEIYPQDKIDFGMSMIVIGNKSGECIRLKDGPYALKNPDVNMFAPNINHMICFRPQLDSDHNFPSQAVDPKHMPSVIQRPFPTGCSKPLELAVCVTLPDMDATCLKKRPDTEAACKILKIVVGEDVPKFPPQIDWHVNTLDTFDRIFTKVCPLVPESYLKIISTMMDYYVSVAYANKTSIPVEAGRPFWQFIRKALAECEAKITPFNFTDVPFKTTTQYKREIRFRNMTPKGHVETHLFFFTELADREYTFNKLVEMEWIAFATILGICPKYYGTKVGSITSRLYTMFAEDFLLPLQELWINPAHNSIYKLLFGKYVNHEVHTKAKACLEAAYVQTNTVPYRYQRPLEMNCGEEDNYFLKLPTPEYYQEGDPSLLP